MALTGQNGAYVDDAFGAVHRKHASVYDVAKRLPAYLGDLVKKEVDVLAKTLNNPERPFVVVMGGAKVSDKLCCYRQPYRQGRRYSHWRRHGLHLRLRAGIQGR